MSSNDTLLHQRALNLYHGANQVIQDKTKAFVMFQGLAERGHTKSLLELACMYFLGEGQIHEPGPQFQKAIETWQRLGNRNHNALYGIGVCYHMGSAQFKRDPVKAKEYLEKSAALGNHRAQSMLDQFYKEKPKNADQTESSEMFNRIEIKASNQSDKLYDIIEKLEEGFGRSDRKQLERIKAEMTEVQKCVKQQAMEIRSMKSDLKKTPQKQHNHNKASTSKQDIFLERMKTDLEELIDGESTHFKDEIRDLKKQQTMLQGEVLQNREMITSLKSDLKQYQQQNAQMLQNIMNLLQNENSSIAQIQTLQQAQPTHSLHPRDPAHPPNPIPSGGTYILPPAQQQQQDDTHSQQSLHSYRKPPGRHGKKKTKKIKLPALQDHNNKSAHHHHQQPDHTKSQPYPVFQEFKFDHGRQTNQLPALQTLKKRMFNSLDVNKEIHQVKMQEKKKKRRKVIKLKKPQTDK